MQKVYFILILLGLLTSLSFAQTLSVDRQKYHDVHTDELLAPSQCKGCHAPKESRLNRAINKRECQQCHDPSDEARPTGSYASSQKACVWCHRSTPNFINTAHELAGHNEASCTSCHVSPHNSVKPARTQCIACHKNKTTHEANASSCYSCHIFSNRHTHPDPVGNSAPVSR